MEKIKELSFILAIKLADAVLTEVVDEAFEDPVKLRYSRARLPIALRFIDTRKFKMTKRITERRYDIGYVGRLEKEKGLYDLVVAIMKLHKKGINPSVLIVGSGSLFQFIRGALYGLNNIEVMSHVPHWRLPEIYNEIKILVLPSRKEGVPTVLLESLACGTIPIVSKVGGMPWLIRRLGVGFILNDFGPDPLVEVLLHVLSLSPDELERMSRMASYFVEEHFNLERAIERYRVIKMI